MTRREREQIHEAMDLLWNQDDALGALVILKKLVGMDTTTEDRFLSAEAVEGIALLRRLLRK